MSRRIGTLELSRAYARWFWSRTFGRSEAAAQLRASVRDILASARFSAVDVGAAIGLPDHWQWLDGEAFFHLVEPRAEACRDLRTQVALKGFSEKYVVHEAAVSDLNGPRTLYVANMPTGTSLLQCDYGRSIDAIAYSNPQYLLPIREVSIVTETLNDLLDRSGEAAVHMIKLDVQGAELECLRGLGSRVKDLLAVELEVGMHGIYPAGHEFADAQAFLQSQGFEIYDVRVARTYLPQNGDDTHYQREVLRVLPDSPTMAARLWEFDAIYFRSRSELLKRANASEIRRMVVAYLTYNFYAEALQLSSMAGKAGILAVADATALAMAVKRIHDLKALRPWYLDSPLNARLLTWLQRISPRNGPRWSQHTYQNYPNG